MADKIIVAGGSGYIGQALCQQLLDAGYMTIVLTRDVERSRGLLSQKIVLAQWDGRNVAEWYHHLDGAKAIINLTGESIGTGRWTSERKQRIRDSRIQSGTALIAAMRNIKHKPKVFIQASGIGIYGDRGDDVLDETSPAGKGFLAELAKQWEQSVLPVRELGARLVYIRTGVVIGANAAFLKRVTLPFQWFLGGHLGSGKQWISWIHLHDEVASILFLLARDDLEGPFNLSAPNPVPAKTFFKILGNVMNRPSWFHVPSFILKMALGEMAKELVLSGQRATPARLLKAGFGFRFPELEMALTDILLRQ